MMIPTPICGRTHAVLLDTIVSFGWSIVHALFFCMSEEVLCAELLTRGDGCVFFFQAEDGIRDDLVTGVQTCALPILCYILLFPTGQLQWHPKIPLNVQEEQPRPHNNNDEKTVSLGQYFHYRLHIRPADLESNHLFLAGKLFQEYICEAWAVAEQKRLGQLKKIQKQLRAEIYQGLADTIAANADTNLNNLGQHFILPSSFTGGT